MRHPTRRRRRWSLEGSALQLSLKAPPPKLALPYQTNRRWSQEGSALQAFSPSRVKAAVGRRVPVLGAVVGRLIPGAVGSPSCLPWGGRPPSQIQGAVGHPKPGTSVPGRRRSIPFASLLNPPLGAYPQDCGGKVSTDFCCDGSDRRVKGQQDFFFFFFFFWVCAVCVTLPD